MYAHALYIENPFRPAEKRTLPVIARRTIGSLAPKTSAPVVCLRNGRAIMREQWSDDVLIGDSIAFVTLPQGGGDSNPLAIFAAIAVMVFAPMIASAIAPSLGVAAGTTAMSFLEAGIGIAGMALVNALIPPPKPPSFALPGGELKQSPTYTLSAQGNQARLGQTIPSMYGNMRVFPDFSGQPYWQFDDNDDQFLYVALTLGHGYFDINSVRVEDTAVENFAEITWTKFDPGAPFTDFNPHVVTASEVSSQELFGPNEDDYDWVGPYTINRAGTKITSIGVDIVAPAGLIDASAGPPGTTTTASWAFYYRSLDDNGNPNGQWSTLGSGSLTLAQVDPVRRSYTYTVPAGRYEVRGKRTNNRDTEIGVQDRIVWAGLRGYMRSDNAEIETEDGYTLTTESGSELVLDHAIFSDVTTIGLVMKATNNLSQQASTRINVQAQRKLPIYDPETQTWSANTATRNIAWALADIMRSSYGGGLADSDIDLDGLADLADTWGARNEYFDGTFDSPSTLWQSLQTVARTGRSVPVFQGGRIRFIRDNEQSAIAALFTPHNIRAGSLNVDYIMASDETADGVEVTYLDRSTWLPTTVTQTATGAAATRLARVEMFGVTEDAHATREAEYMAKANLYRRKLISFDTEYDGFIPTYGDLITVSHDMPAWGQYATAENWDSQNLTLTVEQSLVWDFDATHYVGIRTSDGSVVGPYAVTRGAADNVLVFSESPATPINTVDTKRTQLAFGPGAQWSERCRVMSIEARGMNHVSIVAVSDPVDAEGNSLVLYGGKKGLIGANSLANYTGASAGELATYAWIGDSDGLMSDGEPGWTIGLEGL